MNIRPYVVCSFDWAGDPEPDWGGDPEPETPECFYGWFTGEVDWCGKHTFAHLALDCAPTVTMGADALHVHNLPHIRNFFLFEHEIGEIHYQDEVLSARRALHEEREAYAEGVYSDDARRHGSDE